MYNPDKPIKKHEEDLLGRSDFAKQLAEAIIMLSTKDTYVVGLYGEWGSGKTSVLNLTEEVLMDISGKDKNDKVTIVRFNPWGYTDGTQLIQQFFSVLSSEIQSDTRGNKRKAIGEALEKYSFLLNSLKYIPVVGPFLTDMPELAGKIGSQLKDGVLSIENNVQCQKKLVKKALASFPRKIVIFIDDLDRLPNDYIRMIFQLVNSVADFPNITYVLSFDKNIVVRALKEVQNCNGDDYLEKIIQMPFVLPKASGAKLETILINKINEIIVDTTDSLLDQTHWQIIYKSCIFPFIRTMRDITRLFNVVKFKYSPLKNEINCVDFIGLTALEVFAPSLYDWIKINKDVLTSRPDNNNNSFSQREENKSEWSGNFKGLFGDFAEIYLQAVIDLFPIRSASIEYLNENISDADLRKAYHIGHPDRFDMYFTLSLGNKLLSRKNEQYYIYAAEEEELSNYLSNAIEQEVIRDLIYDIRDIVEDVPETRIPVVVRSLSSVLKQVPDEVSSPLTYSALAICEFTLNDFLRRITNENDRYLLFSNLIEVSDATTFTEFASMISSMEYDLGRMGGKKISESEIIFSEKTIIKIEKQYAKRLKKILSNNDIISLRTINQIIHLWEFIDAKQLRTFMNLVQQIPEYVFHYVSSVASKGFSSDGILWKFYLEENFTKYITVTRVAAMIDEAIQNRSIILLPEEIKTKLAAFKLCIQENSRYSFNSVPDKDAKRLVAEWQKSV